MTYNGNSKFDNSYFEYDENCVSHVYSLNLLDMKITCLGDEVFLGIKDDKIICYVQKRFNYNDNYEYEYAVIEIDSNSNHIDVIYEKIEKYKSNSFLGIYKDKYFFRSYLNNDEFLIEKIEIIRLLKNIKLVVMFIF